MTQSYAVETFDHIFNEEGEALAGDVDQETHVMRLASHHHHDEVVETYLHEVLHVLLHKANYGSIQMGESPNEDIVNSLSPILLAFIRENPAVIRYLRKGFA